MSLISTAVAVGTQGATQAVGQTAGGQQDPMSLILMVAVFIAVFYFLLWRPQSKRNKEHRNLISGVQSGDEVATAGGILGKVAKVQENTLTLKIAENIEITVQKAAVTSMLPKGTLKNL